MKEKHSQEGAPAEKFITPDIMAREIMYNIPDTQIPEEDSESGSDKNILIVEDRKRGKSTQVKKPIEELSLT